MAEAIQWLNDKIVSVKYEKKETIKRRLLSGNGHFFAVEIMVYKVLNLLISTCGADSGAH